MNNGKTIREALRKAKKQVEKPNAYKHDVLYTNLGQWKYPGQVTRIPSNDITMQGVPYPVYGEDDLGYGQMMYPGMDYTFPGQYVTEIPMAQVGVQTPPKKTNQDDVLKRYNDLLKGDEELFSQIEKDKNTPVFTKIGNTITDAIKNKIKSDYDPTGLVYENIKSAGEYIKGLVGGAERKWESMQEEDPRSIVNRNTSKVTTPKTLPSKKTAKSETKQPDISFGYKELDTKPDVYNPKDSLVVFTNTFDNDQGARYMIGHKIKEVTDAGAQKTFNNARAVAHFLRDSDILPNQKITPKEWTVAKGYKYKTTSPGKTVSAQGFNDPEKFRTLYKPNPANDGTYLVKYLKNKELTPEKSKDYSKEGWELDFTVSNQHKFSDVAWDEEGPSTGYLAKSKWLPLKNGKHTHIPYKNKKGFSRFSGGSVIYLFKDPKSGKSIGVDVAGSVNDIKEAGEDIIKKYGIKPENLELAYHDMGSYSAKPKAHGDKLDYSQWLDYNDYNRGFSGAPLIIPKEEYGGDPSLPNITGHYPFGGQNTKTHTHMKEGGWLDEYQPGGRVMPSETTQSQVPAYMRNLPKSLKEAKQKQKKVDEGKAYEKAIQDVYYKYHKDKADKGSPIALGRSLALGVDPVEAEKTITKQNEEYARSSAAEDTEEYLRPVNDEYLKEKGLEYASYLAGPEMFEASALLKQGIKKLPSLLKKSLNKKVSATPFKINVEPNSNISADFNKKVEDVIQKNIDRIKSDTYKKRRIANTGETEEQFNKSINKYINNIEKAKFNFPNYGPKSTAEGVYYQPGSLFGLDLGRHKINVHTVGKTEDDILQVFDHEVKHMLSPSSKNSEYKLYKNYPALEINPTIKNKDYYLLPEEQQVRFNRLNEKIRKDLNINKENLSLEDILYWNKNYQDDLLKGPKGYSDMKKLFKAAKNPISATTLKNVLNKSWAVLPAAIAAGAYQQQENGGSIGGDDFRRGGLYTPPKIKRKAKKYGTSKNIQSSINKLFTRNYDVFGPGGKNIYNPNVYKTGGWLDFVD